MRAGSALTSRRVVGVVSLGVAARDPPKHSRAANSQVRSAILGGLCAYITATHAHARLTPGQRPNSSFQRKYLIQRKESVQRREPIQVTPPDPHLRVRHMSVRAP